MKIKRFDLRINSRKIPLNIFVRNFVASTVLGMLKALKEVQKIKNVYLEIELDKEV